jgi:hypothetical protein
LACALTYSERGQARGGRFLKIGDFVVIRQFMAGRIHCDDEGEEREKFGKHFV